MVPNATIGVIKRKGSESIDYPEGWGDQPNRHRLDGASQQVRFPVGISLQNSKRCREPSTGGGNLATLQGEVSNKSQDPKLSVPGTRYNSVA